VRDKINGTSCAINLARLGFFLSKREKENKRRIYEISSGIKGARFYS